MKPFVPCDFIVPLSLEHPQFILRPLVITDVVKDYEAVMTSIDHLQGTFGLSTQWPSPELAFEQDMIDLGWHHKEFQNRTSFAYTMMTKDESLCLGCTYIYPSTHRNYEAEAYCWVRKSHVAKLDQVLYETFKTWLQNTWPFKKVAFPGREPNWVEWQITAKT